MHSKAEVSKRHYSSKAKSSNVRDLLDAKNTVDLAMKYSCMILQLYCCSTATKFSTGTAQSAADLQLYYSCSIHVLYKCIIVITLNLVVCICTIYSRSTAVPLYPGREVLNLVQLYGRNGT